MSREIRILSSTLKEERGADGKAPRLVGYAAVFNSETDIGGMFREKILPGAFASSLASSDVHALFNHDENMVLGRAKAGTLVLTEDAHGLKVEIDPPDTQDARDLMAKMRRGDIDQMSFAFSMAGGVQTWDDSADPPLRSIQKVGELFDVSVVTRGAYPTTDVAVRSLDAVRRKKNFRAAAKRLRQRMTLDLKTRRTAP